MYTIVKTSKFDRDFKRIIKRGYKPALLYDVVQKLAKGEVLDARYKDHALKGKYTGFRECHISTNWLLVYKKADDILVLVLIGTGTHSDLKIGEK